MRLDWLIDDEKLQRAIVDLYKYNQMLPREHRSMYKLVKSLEDKASDLARNHCVSESPELEIRKAEERGFIKAFFIIAESLESIEKQFSGEIL